MRFAIIGTGSRRHQLGRDHKGMFAQPRRAAERGIEPSGGPALLPCYPRLFDFTFNPPSVYVG
jgi:hypothetical protein